MSRKLVTIATFDQAPQAHLARNVVEAAGVRATVADESLVSMDWLLANAVGGIKVQVWEEDAERAVRVLEEAFGEHGEMLHPGGVGPADASPPEAADHAGEDLAGEDEDDPAGSQAADGRPPVDDGPPGERDAYARRCLLSAVFSILCPPLAFFTVYLILNASFGPGELSPRGRRRLRVSLALTALALLLDFLSIGYWLNGP